MLLSIKKSTHRQDTHTEIHTEPNTIPLQACARWGKWPLIPQMLWITSAPQTFIYNYISLTCRQWNDWIKFWNYLASQATCKMPKWPLNHVKTSYFCSTFSWDFGLLFTNDLPRNCCFLKGHSLFYFFLYCLKLYHFLKLFEILFTTVLSQGDFSSMGILSCFPRGKPAAAEMHYPTYGACWVF